MNTEKRKTGRRVLKRYTAEDRIKFVEEYNKSELRQSEFCREKGINPTTFYGWLGKTPKNKTRFVEVKLPSTPANFTNNCIELKLSSGEQLNIPIAMNIDRIADLVRRVTEC